MKRKRGRPRKSPVTKHTAVQIRVETNEILTEYQNKIQQNLGYKVSKNDLIHIAISRLVADDPI